MTSPFSFIALHIFIFVLSVVTALFEIQIEGPSGWAKRLPTWRVTRKILQEISNRTDFTGYHLYFNILLLLLFHFPLLVAGWSWTAELDMLSCFMFYNILWDFLWFVLNPAFGWSRYSKANIWWFRKWLGPFPADYYLTIIVSAFFSFLSGTTAQAGRSTLLGAMPTPLQHLLGWVAGASVSLLATLVVMYFKRTKTAVAGK